MKDEAKDGKGAATRSFNASGNALHNADDALTLCIPPKAGKSNAQHQHPVGEAPPLSQRSLPSHAPQAGRKKNRKRKRKRKSKGRKCLSAPGNAPSAAELPERSPSLRGRGETPSASRTDLPLLHGQGAAGGGGRRPRSSSHPQAKGQARQEGRRGRRSADVEHSASAAEETRLRSADRRSMDSPSSAYLPQEQLEDLQESFSDLSLTSPSQQRSTCRSGHAGTSLPAAGSGSASSEAEKSLARRDALPYW